MTPTERLSTARVWPGIAAGIAAFAGMSSCIGTVMPLTAFGAPLLGAGVTALLFAFLLALRPAATSEPEQRDRVRFAAASAWLVSIATCWRFATRVQDGLSGDSSMYRGAVGQVSIVGGAALGFLVALLIQRIGMAQYRRQAGSGESSSGTVAERMGAEPFLRTLRRLRTGQRPQGGQ